MPPSINNVVVLLLVAVLTIGSNRLPATAGEAGRLSHDMLAQLVRTCAPEVDSTTQAAIVAVESGGSSLVLHDDNDDRVYDPGSRSEAQITLTTLLARDRLLYAGRNRGIDVGLAQINTNNLAYLGVSAGDLLDPCTNLHASARVIVDAYVRERSILASEGGWRGDEIALRRALQDYNSGRPSGDDAYVRAVYATLDQSLVRDVGNAGRRAPVPIIPLYLARTEKYVPNTPARRSTLFYHASWAAPQPQPSARSIVFKP